MKPCLTFLVVMAMLTLAGLLISSDMVSAKPSSSVWFVAPGGSDDNACLSAGLPCATINGVLSKPGFVPGDMVLVASGTYTGTGNALVVLSKDTTLSGGWNTTFTTQSGMSTLEAQRMQQGIIVNSGVTASAERFVIRNGLSDSYAGGIHNNGTLTLDRMFVTNNSSGISNNGTLVLNNSVIAGNNSSFLPGGIHNKGTVTLNGSTISENNGAGGGGIGNNGTLTLNNSTVSGNDTGSYGGGGIHNDYGTTGVLSLNSSTVTGNTAASGGGIDNYYGSPVILQNTVVAGNTALFGGPDCSGSIGSAGYNLVGDISGCSFTSSIGDLTNIVPLLGPLLGPSGAPRYHPLLSGSPAIDAGNPGGCAGSAGPLTRDQRGVARVGRCDIGAYEYTIPGSAASLYAYAGTFQHAPPLGRFNSRLQAAVQDNIGSPVSGVTVTFTAPSSGASGIFTNTGSFTTTALTNLGGIATAEDFVANGAAGTYPVTATVNGVTTSTNFLLSNILWYVAPTGSDNNDCVHSTAACATIDGALGKAEFLPGDTILVAMGTYTSPAAMGIWLRKDVILSGGWDIGFAAQSGQSTIDGQGTRRGFSVDSGVKVLLDRFNIQHGRDDNGAGIWNSGDLTVTHSTISYNAAGHAGWSGYGGGGGIENNNGRLALINSAVTSNTLVGGFNGSGVFNGGTMTIDNTTISGNSGPEGIYNNPNDSLTLNNTTVSGNSNYGFRIAGLAYMQNTIIAGNGIDCLTDQINGGALTSLGYNLVQNNLDCTLTNTDRTGLDPRLNSLQGSPPYHPLRLGSMAINGGNPAGCMGSTGLLVTDQRGMPRVGRCDIGAVEYQEVVFQTLLALVTRNYAAPCPPLFADDFSNPNSSWPTGNNSYVLREYLNGEYHMQVKDFDMWAGSTSGASFSDFIASIDITNANITAGSFGVIFGLSPSDWSQFYTYEIETVPSGRYGLYMYSQGNWTTLAEGSSNSIGAREARNHIAVERNGSLINAYANGNLLASVSESSYVGTRRVGLIVTAFNTTPVDVRFDNFSIFAPGCTAKTAANDMTATVVNTFDKLFGDEMESPGGDHK